MDHQSINDQLHNCMFILHNPLSLDYLVCIYQIMNLDHLDDNLLRILLQSQWYLVYILTSPFVHLILQQPVPFFCFLFISWYKYIMDHQKAMIPVVLFSTETIFMHMTRMNRFYHLSSPLRIIAVSSRTIFT